MNQSKQEISERTPLKKSHQKLYTYSEASKKHNFQLKYPCLEPVLDYQTFMG